MAPLPESLSQFFQFIARSEFQSPYYTALGYLLSGLLKKQYYNDGKWRLFDKYLANIELIPYHSEGIQLPPDFSSFQLAYLTERYKVGLEFIRRYNPKLLIFNGNVWRNLLVKKLLVQVDEKVSITQKFNMYFLNYMTFLAYYLISSFKDIFGESQTTTDIPQSLRRYI